MAALYWRGAGSPLGVVVAVLPNTGTRLVPEYFCPIPEQIVLKAEQIVYRFELPHSGLLASFRNRSFKDQANCKAVQPS